MRRIYVSHPFRGHGPLDISRINNNVNAVNEICREIGERFSDVLVVSPIHAFSFVSAFEPQVWVLEQCCALVEFADELWTFGDWQKSEGCVMEVATARELLVPVHDGHAMLAAARRAQQ